MNGKTNGPKNRKKKRKKRAIADVVTDLIRVARGSYPYAEKVTGRDVPAIAALSKLSFGPLAYTAGTFHALRKANPNILLRVKDRHGTTVGYIDIIPIKETFAQGLISGSKSEGDLRPTDVVAENEIDENDDGYVYLAGLVVRSDLLTGSRRRLTMAFPRLVAVAFDRVQQICSHSKGFSKVIATAYASEAGATGPITAYLKALGFKHVGRSKDGNPVYVFDLHKEKRFNGVLAEINGRRERFLRARGKLGKKRATADEVLKLVTGIDTLDHAQATIVGNYRRFEQQTVGSLRSRAEAITHGLRAKTNSSENFLIWAAPGTGKSYFIEQIAESLGKRIEFFKVDFAKMEKADVEKVMNDIRAATEPSLVLYDEIDAKEGADWPYDISFKALELNHDANRRAVFVLIGSKPGGLDRMIEGMSKRVKGQDLLDRVPELNRFEIPPPALGDRIVVLATQVGVEAERRGLKITNIDKMALYFVLSNNKFNTPRQITELVKKCLSRMVDKERALGYDHFFEAKDAGKHRFWANRGDALRALANTKLRLLPGRKGKRAPRAP